MAVNDIFRMRLVHLLVVLITIPITKPLGHDEADICQICSCFENYRSTKGIYVNCRGVLLGNDINSPTLEPDLIPATMNVTQLILSYCALHNINGSIFLRLPELNILYIDDNMLWELPTFHSLKMMQYLYVNYNAIQDIPPAFASSVPNLLTLGLTFNKLRQINGHMLPPLLIHLDLTGNLIHTVTNESFVGLDRLGFLSLMQNRISYIPNEAFSHLNLSTLRLDHNRISVMEPFCLSGSLRILIINANKLTNLSALTNTPRLITAHLETQQSKLSLNAIPNFPDLQVATFNHVTDNDFLGTILTRAPFLQSLKMTNGHIPQIQLVKHQYLRALELSSNLVETIEHLTNVLSLYSIELSNNLFRSIPEFHGLLNLKTLRMNNNQINFLDAGKFRNLSNLRVIEFMDNVIVSLVGQFENPNLRTILLDRNRIKRIDSDVFSHLLLFHTLEITENKITISSNFSDIPGLQSIESQGNDISMIDPKSFRNMLHLLYLDLSNNVIRYISKFAFLPRLKRLLLNNNAIVFIDNHAFSLVSNLNTLSLQNTTIRNFPMAVLPFVETIDISRNKLTSIPNNISILFPSLHHIDVSHNHINTFNSDALKELSYLQLFKLNGNLISYLFILSCPFVNELKTFHFDLTTPMASCMTELVKIPHLFILGGQLSRIPDTILCNRGNISLEEIEIYETNDNCTLRTSSPIPARQSNRSKKSSAIILRLRNVSVSGLQLSDGVDLIRATTFTFVESNLVDIPNWYGPKVRHLNFSRNVLQTFNISRFVMQFPRVFYLYLDNNDIKSLAGCDRLDTVHHLHELHLSGNDLVRFPGGNCGTEVYGIFYALKVLDLTSNSLTQIDKELIPVSSKLKRSFEVEIFVTENNLTCECSQRLLPESDDDITIYGSCFSPLLRSQFQVIHSVKNVTCPLSRMHDKACAATENASILIQCPVTSHPLPFIQWIFQESPDVGFLQLGTGLVSINDSRLRIVGGGIEFRPTPNRTVSHQQVSMACRAVDAWQNAVIFVIDALISTTVNDREKAENISVACEIDVYHAHDASIAPSSDSDAIGNKTSNATPPSGDNAISKSASSSYRVGLWTVLRVLCVIAFHTIFSVMR